MVQDYVNRLLGLIERWGWSIGLILIASIFFVMACAAIISSPAALDPTTAPAFHVAGGLLGAVLVVELAGGFALVTGFKRRIGAIALLILLVITTMVVHRFWTTRLGRISEIFDAESPYTPRGCCAQAWSVAEILRLMTVIDTSMSIDRKPDTSK